MKKNGSTAINSINSKEINASCLIILHFFGYTGNSNTHSLHSYIYFIKKKRK